MTQKFSVDYDRIRHLPEGPLKMARMTLWWLRKTVFSREKPENPAVFVDKSEQEIVEILGAAYFEPGWEFSYSYRNEVLNLRRPEYVKDHPLGYEWWQAHVRGYKHDARRFELAAHFELDPTEYPSAHVEQVGLDIERGNESLMEVLDANDVDYEYVLPE